MSPRTASIVGGIGRSFIATGLLILSFAGFQLWGTGIAEGRAQDDLAEDFEALRLAYADATTGQSGGAATNGQSDGAAASDDLPGNFGSPSTSIPDAHATTPTTDATGSAVEGSSATPSTTLPTLDAEQVQEPAQVAPEVPKELLPGIGDPLGVIKIPKIEVDKVIIQGVGRDDLRKGPGHYAQTVLPGQAGNASIAGHRTTYGAPFGDIDQLVPGDSIQVDTFQGTFFYEVLPQEQADGTALGHSIVTPFDVHVIDDYGDNRLTLTACHPKYSARERIVVQAKLVSEPAPIVELPEIPQLDASSIASEQLDADGLPYDPRVDTAEATGIDANGQPVQLDEGNAIGGTDSSLDESLGWHMEELDRVLIWGFFAALVALIAVIVGRRWRSWPAYLSASPAFLLALFFCFTHLDRMLPAF